MQKRQGLLKVLAFLHFRDFSYSPFLLYTRKPRVRRVVQKRLSRRGGKKNSFCFEIVVVSYNQKQKEVTQKKMNDK